MMNQAEREAFGKRVRRVGFTRLEDMFYDYRHSDAETMNLTEEDMTWILDTIMNEIRRRIK